MDSQGVQTCNIPNPTAFGGDSSLGPGAVASHVYSMFFYMDSIVFHMFIPYLFHILPTFWKPLVPYSFHALHIYSISLSCFPTEILKQHGNNMERILPLPTQISCSEPLHSVSARQPEGPCKVRGDFQQRAYWLRYFKISWKPYYFHIQTIKQTSYLGCRRKWASQKDYNYAW